MTRDLMLPALWISGWLGSEFVWRGNPMRSVTRTRRRRADALPLALARDPASTHDRASFNVQGNHS